MNVNDIKLVDLYTVIPCAVGVRYVLEGDNTEVYYDIFDVPEYQNALVSAVDPWSEDCLEVRFFYYA